MRGVHEPAELLEVAGDQCRGRVFHPVVLRDDVPAPLPDHRLEVSLQCGERLDGDIPKERDPRQVAREDGDPPGALLAARVVGGRGKSTLHAGFADDQSDAGGEREMLRSEGPAIDLQRVPLPAAGADVLVHDSALHPDELVLRPLAEPDDVQRGEGKPVESEERVRRCDLQRGR
jgi:hypothetical protein